MYLNVELEQDLIVAIQKFLVLLHDYLRPDTKKQGLTHTHAIIMYKEISLTGICSFVVLNINIE